MALYLVLFTNGQYYTFTADDTIHALDQAHNAEPNLSIKEVFVCEKVWPIVQ
jgi:hypothetical protein